MSKEKERLMREAMRKVRAEVEAEAEHLHIRMRVEGGAPEAKVGSLSPEWQGRLGWSS